MVFHGNWDAQTMAPQDQREVRSIAWLTRAELASAIREGQIQDGVTLAALTLARVQGVL